MLPSVYYCYSPEEALQVLYLLLLLLLYLLSSRVGVELFKISMPNKEVDRVS